MLYEDNIDKINDLIDDELRNAARPFLSHPDKLECLERVAKLKSLLEPTPDPETIRKTTLTDLAAALRETERETAPKPESIMDVIFGVINR